MPVEFLSDEEAAVFGRYAGLPTRADLDRMFYLDDADLRLTAKRRGEHMRLGFAQQLVTARYLGTFLTDPLDVPPLVTEHLAKQLGIDDPRAWPGTSSGGTRRSSTGRRSRPRAGCGSSSTPRASSPGGCTRGRGTPVRAGNLIHLMRPGDIR
jgi:hypothetical protein